MEKPKKINSSKIHNDLHIASYQSMFHNKEWYSAKEMDAYLEEQENGNYILGYNRCENNLNAEWRDKIDKTLEAYKDYPVGSESEAKLLQSIQDNFGNLIISVGLAKKPSESLPGEKSA